MKTPKIVTKEWLAARIAADQTGHVVGRALVAIFNNQTREERYDNVTKHNNGIGFTGPDARAGCIVAKYFLKHGHLEPWQINIWTKPDKRGLPRIVKYADQLNQIATNKLMEHERA